MIGCFYKYDILAKMIKCKVTFIYLFCGITKRHIYDTVTEYATNFTFDNTSQICAIKCWVSKSLNDA